MPSKISLGSFLPQAGSELHTNQIGIADSSWPGRSVLANGRQLEAALQSMRQKVALG